MRIVVTGSIATDYLMTFPGRIAEQLVTEQLSQISLSFLADELDLRRGGVAANITFGLGQLGFNPVLVGAVGADFGDYRDWLESHGVDTASVWVSETRHTARFVCTSDVDENQIATFYAGAMVEANQIELGPVVDRVGPVDLVLISPDDPDAMLSHAAECRRLGVPFASDPSQQLARLDGDAVRELVAGGRFLFTNEYEAALLLDKTGWTREDVLGQVGMWIVTHGAAGARLHSAGVPVVEVAAVPIAEVVDPTGGGDAFRSGFLAGIARDLPPEQAAKLGCALATLALETVGTQEYQVDPGALAEKITATYDTRSAALVCGALPMERTTR